MMAMIGGRSDGSSGRAGGLCGLKVIAVGSGEGVGSRGGPDGCRGRAVGGSGAGYTDGRLAAGGGGRLEGEDQAGVLGVLTEGNSGLFSFCVLMFTASVWPEPPRTRFMASIVGRWGKRATCWNNSRSAGL